MQELFQEVVQSSFLSIIAIVLFSACIGSFLNVVIYRLPVMLEREWKIQASEILELDPPEYEKFNLAFPESTCPKCQNKIKPWFNIPVLGWLMLRGKCLDCSQPISIRYPMVEAITACLGVLLYLALGPSVQLLAMLLFTYVCIALTGIDFDHQLLPDILVLPLLWLGLVLNIDGTFVPLEKAVIGAVCGYGVLWLVFWAFKLATGKEGMGYGDFKLLATFGAWFGWAILPNVILLSSLVGAVIGIFLILFKGRDSQQPMPFGPFIIIAGWLTAVYPEYAVVMNYLVAY